MNIGGAIGNFLGFDPTPGFNITRSTKGVPFVAHEVAAPKSGGSAPAAAPAPAGSTSTGGSSAAYVAAQQAQARADAAKRAAYGTQEGAYTGGARTSLRDVGNAYNDKTIALLDALEGGQHDINEGSIQNALNLRKSMQNIVQSVRSGVRSGGVTLAGMNASDSGAADALARAWAKVGNSQTGEAQGQASTVDQDLQYKQGTLNRQKDEGVNSLETYKGTETGRVRSDFGSKLDMLQADASQNGIDDVVHKSLVDQVLGEALSRLATIDAMRSQRLGGLHAVTEDERNSEAQKRDAAGAAASIFSVEKPVVAVGGAGGAPINGAPLGQLPIFVKQKDDTADQPVLA